MAASNPAALFRLHVPAGDDITPATADFPARFRVTMAAIDPTAPMRRAGNNGGAKARATLKIMTIPRSFLDSDDEDSDEDDMDEDDLAELKAKLAAGLPDGDSSDDEEKGGPSDPEQRKKARADALMKKIMDQAAEDEDLKAVNGVNGTKSDKGKAKALPSDDEDSSIDSDDGENLEEFVICTLDPENHYQQTLDFTITEDEQAYFKVIGTHDVFLTGNYIMPADDEDDSGSNSDDDPYGMDMGVDGDDIDMLDGYDSDELDDIEDPRFEEVDSDDDEEVDLSAKMAAAKGAKGKNKRVASQSAEDDSTDKALSLDDLINKSMKPEEAKTNGEKLSKKQAKKLKNNSGQAVAVEGTDDKSNKGIDAAAKNGTNGKKVQFAKNLEQGPTPSQPAKAADKGKDGKSQPGIKMVQGVKVDDRKIGSGPLAKKGDKIGMRYIGKLEKGGAVFDSNKKGKPFEFKLGTGEVIKGWDIGVAGMQVGGERRITIPANLAYGSKGVPGIPGNSNLIFEIKMLSLK